MLNEESTRILILPLKPLIANKNSTTEPNFEPSVPEPNFHRAIRQYVCYKATAECQISSTMDDLASIVSLTKVLWKSLQRNC